jgi:hypothetical protein
MFKLDYKIKICEQCAGWGVIQEGTCSKCNGSGAYIQEAQENLVFELPSFIDYGKRKKILYVKSAILLIGAFLALLLISIVAITFSQLLSS